MKPSSRVALSGSCTSAIHADAGEGFSTHLDVAPPLSLSSTFEQAADGCGYARISNPTRNRCEQLLGAVESLPSHPAHAVLYASGLAASFAVLARLMPANVYISGGYHGTHMVLKQLQRLSGGAKFATQPLSAATTGSLSPGDLIWLETPLNPTCTLLDIAEHAAAAKAVGGVHLVVDSTFAPPPLQRPLTLGADVVMHSTTKALAGHSDAVGGALCVSDPELAAALREDRTGLGSTPGQMEVWLLMRSLRTLHLRVSRMSDTASWLAEWLHCATEHESHPLKGLVAAVHHASLPSHPSHQLAARQMPGGAGSCLALELSTEEAAKALPGALELFRDATSLGGVESLIEWRRKYDDDVSPLLVRLSIGLEEPEHLKNDLERGIMRVSAPC